MGDTLFTHNKALHVSFLWLILITVFLLLVFYTGTRSYAHRWLFGSILFLFFLLLGAGISYHKLSDTYTFWPDKEAIWYGTLQESPKEKEKSFACKIRIDHCYPDDKQYFMGKQCLLYIIKDSLVGQLQAGSTLWFSSKISSPPVITAIPENLIMPGICRETE